MKYKILLLIVSLFLIVPSVSAVSYHNYGVTENEQKLIEEENKNENNSILEQLEDRFIDNDERDIYDYTILTCVILFMIVVIAFLNKKTYVTFKEQSVFEIE